MILYTISDKLFVKINRLSPPPKKKKNLNKALSEKNLCCGKHQVCMNIFYTNIKFKIPYKKILYLANHILTLFDMNMHSIKFKIGRQMTNLRFLAQKHIR